MKQIVCERLTVTCMAIGSAYEVLDFLCNGDSLRSFPLTTE